MKQIKHISCLLCMAMLLLAVGSCRKGYLELNPYNSLDSKIAINNYDDMATAMNGVYAGLRSADLYGRTLPLFADLVADNVYISTDNSNRYLSFFQVNYTATSLDVEGLWQAAYGVILNANNIINCPLQGTAETDQLRGEALSVRALMYFELAKHFCKPYTVDPNATGVPIVLSYDPFAKPSRQSLQALYTQIEKDLTDAIPLLKLDKSSGYFTRYAAMGLLARMYEYKGDWSNALDMAESVIDNSDYQLLQANQFLNYWKTNTPNSNHLETLFEVVFDLVGNAGNSSLAYFYDQAGYGDALCSDDLYDSYSASDLRKQLILLGSPTRGDVYVVNKYPNSTQPDKDEFKVLRMSEIFLIAAEAAYQLQEEDLARTYLNAVAMQRDPAFGGYQSSGNSLLEAILTERRKELAFEGQRYWDLARYNRDVVRVNTGGNYPGNVPLLISSSNYHRILPIPQSELDANPQIRAEQNPGY